MRKDSRQITFVSIILIAIFLFITFYSSRSPSIVVEFNGDDVALAKIGIVSFSGPLNIACIGDYIRATVLTPSGKNLTCTKGCVERIGKVAIDCPDMQKENGTYSVSLKIYESQAPDSELLLTRDLYGSWKE